MKIYLTRHGQIEKAQYVDGNPLFPLGEPELSALGKKQAAYLGKRLKSMGFKGKIFSSPYVRTMQTAQIISEITEIPVHTFAPIREIMKTQEQVDTTTGKTLDELKEMFDCIDESSELDYPWWSFVPENHDMVYDRVKKGFDALFPTLNCDCLIIGHGASFYEANRVLGVPISSVRCPYNCSLSMLDTEKSGDEKYISFDVSHIPYEETTTNFMTRAEYENMLNSKPYEGEISIPEGFENIKGTKILHIGDTCSWDYPYYKKLIETVKPDYLIHTGDMADEVKAGRIPEVRSEYLEKTKVILDIMKNSGAKQVFIHFGNNDLPREISEAAPWAKIAALNSDITLNGETFRLCHRVSDLTYEQRVMFYGHGLTGEEWSYDKNEVGKTCRFNASWGSFVYVIEDKTFYKFDRPVFVNNLNC